MTETRAFLALLAIGMSVAGVGFGVLHSLEVGDEGIALFTVLCVVVVSGLAGFLPGRYSDHRRR